MYRITGAAIILVALSGCEIIAGIEDTTEVAGEPDASTVDAPVNNMVDAMPMADATPDADTGDDDNDGVLNPDDNCPNDMNAEQYDEDADGVGDVCDNCPSWANPGQEDELEALGGNEPDGVGDVCDPHPGVVGDRILYFDGFNDDLSLVWTPLSGDTNWITENGMLRNASTTIAINILYWQVTQHDNVVLDTTVIVDAAPDPVDNNDHRSAGPFAAIDVAAQTGYGCAIELDATDIPPSTHARVVRQNSPTMWTIWTEPAMQPLGIGQRYTQRLLFDGATDMVGCTVTGPPGFGTAGRLISEPSYDGGFIGFRTLSTAASFEYITAYTVDPPMP